jgi:outer membrane protein assembly factor BamE
MRLLSPKFDPAPAPLAALACAMLALLLTACSTPNPLMQEPVAANAKEAKPAPQAAAPAAATPSAVPTPSAQAPAAPAAPVAAAPSTPAAPAAPVQAAPAQTTPAVAQAEADGVQTTHSRRFLGFFSPYRPDIQQGNFVSKEMVAQLKEGMTRDQVRFVLGTPLLVDVFHIDRWDYVFRMQKGDGEVTTSRVAVFFKDGRMVRVQGGGDLPTEQDYLARLAGNTPIPKAPAAGTAPAVSAEAATAAAPSAAAPK